MLWLSERPQFLIPAVMVALMVTGLLAPLLVALPAFALVAVFMSWLAFLSWPVIERGQRAARAAMIAVVLFAAVGRVAGWL